MLNLPTLTEAQKETLAGLIPNINPETMTRAEIADAWQPAIEYAGDLIGDNQFDPDTVAIHERTVQEYATQYSKAKDIPRRCPNCDHALPF